MHQGWADRGIEIKRAQGLDPRKATSVTDEVFQDFIQSNYDIFDEKEIKEEFAKKMSELEKTKKSEQINNPVNPFEIDENIDIEINNLLSKVIEEPNLSEREKTIFKILNNQNNRRIGEIKAEFKKDTDICPFCFQEVNDSYKNDLLQSIANIFNTKEADEHKSNLEKINIYDINIGLTEYKTIDENLVKEIENEIKEYNEIRQEVLNKIKDKKTNVYTPINNFKPDLVSKQKEINELLKELEKKRKQFNTNIKEKEKLTKELQEINKKLSWAELKKLDYIELYKTCKKNYDNNNKEKENCEEKIEKLTNQINDLNNKKNNTNLAVEIINNYLTYIFFDKNRLQVEYSDNKYIVKVKDKEIGLKNLSEGEKNAIAMCYFFSTINQNKAEKDFFNHECFIVLDDPISSFDFHNKIGIYSFLRARLDHILTSNNKSFILIMTHQIEAMFHLDTICSDINLKKETEAFVLNHKSLEKFSDNKYYNVYYNLIDTTFKYANDKNRDDSSYIGIGNVMRRLIESFSFFNYNKKLDKFLHDDEILKHINCNKRQEYFKNLMSRLILNNESHFTDQIRSDSFFLFISDEEKLKTAKSLLILLKLLNPLHIKYYLEDENKIDIINEWEKTYFKLNSKLLK